MKSLLHSLLFLLLCISSPAATGDAIIDVLGASGRRVAVTVPKTNDYFIGFDESGNVVAKPGGAGGTWDEITGKPTFGTLATQNGTITDYLTIATAASTYSPLAGSTSISSLGTITTGTWQATVIADAYISSAATWNAKQAALVSGTNIKTINGNSVLGSGNLTITGGISDGATLTTGLTFPNNGLILKDISNNNDYEINIVSEASTNRRIDLDFPDTDTNIQFTGNAVLEGTNTGDQDLTNYLTLDGDGSALIGITAAQVGALADTDTIAQYLNFPNGGVRLLDASADHTLQLGVSEELTANRGLTFTVNNATRTINLSGNLTVPSAATVSGTNTGDITLAGTPDYVTLSGQVLTRNLIDLTTDVTGTLPAANGGTGLTAAGTSGNVLTSNGTTWTSAAPATTNPAGSGSELQFRSTGTAFGALTSSSVSGANLTLGGLLTVTPVAANTGYFSGTGYSLTGSDTTAMINLTGTWNTTGIANGIKLDVTDTASNANSLLMNLTVGGANRFRLFKDGGLFCAATVNGTILNASSYFGGGDSGQFILGSSLDTRLQRDAAAVWAMRNGTNAHTLRIYETDSGANDEYLELTASAGTNLIRPQATGTGTASVVRYFTTTTVWYGSGNGSPEGVHIGGIGSVYTDTANGLLYRKTSGTGSTGWVNP